jgi:hypothetical protein
LPLRASAWNSVEIHLEGQKLSLDLNGTRILERDLEASNSRIFGFYHEKDRTAARVRNVVLRGNWPKSLPVDITAPRAEGAGPAQARIRSELTGEAILCRDAGLLLEQARALPPEERFELLARWVLPGEDHTGFRLAGDFAPTNPAPIVGGKQETRPPGAIRVETGGAVVAPALALVEAAEALGRLDALAERVAQAKPSSDSDRRGQRALMCLIHIAQNHDAEAEADLIALKPLVQKLEPSDLDYQRWPELLAASRALDRLALCDAARALTNVIVTEQLQKEHKGVGELLKTQLLHVNGLAQWLALPEAERTPLGADPALASWARVTHGQARTRGAGFPLPHWSSHAGTLQHFPGHDHDFMYLRVPIVGSFEVGCEVFGQREVQLSYGGIAVGISADRKEYFVTHYGRKSQSFTFTPPLKLADGPFHLRLAVRDGTVALHAGGRPSPTPGSFCTSRRPTWAACAT